MEAFKFIILLLQFALAQNEADRFASFAELGSVYQEGSDFRIHREARDSSLVVTAIHGGTIEPGTLELARAVAGRDHSFYAFEGRVLTEASWDLHLTSTHFDEPSGVRLIESHPFCLSIHGFSNPARGPTVILGGLNASFKRAILSALRTLQQDYPELVIQYSSDIFQGTHPRNIVNRAKHQGVQIELSGEIREKLTMDAEFFWKFRGALRRGWDRFVSRARVRGAGRCGRSLE